MMGMQKWTLQLGSFWKTWNGGDWHSRTTSLMNTVGSKCTLNLAHTPANRLVSFMLAHISSTANLLKL